MVLYYLIVADLIFSFYVRYVEIAFPSAFDLFRNYPTIGAKCKMFLFHYTSNLLKFAFSTKFWRKINQDQRH